MVEVKKAKGQILAQANKLAHELEKSELKINKNAIKLERPTKTELLKEFILYINRYSLQDINYYTTVSSIDTAAWFDSFTGLEQLLFQLYAISWPNQDKLKKLARKLDKYRNLNDDYKYWKKYSNKYDYYGPLAFYGLWDVPDIINMLWERPITRMIAQTWLELYQKVEAHHSLEDESYQTVKCSEVNRLIWLLRGINTSNEQIELKPYKRLPKRNLSKKNWKKQWLQQSRYLTGFWN